MPSGIAKHLKKQEEMYKKIGEGDIEKGKDEVLVLPRTVRMCGIIPDDQEVYKYLNKIAANEIEEEDECPPPPRKEEERERFNCDSSEDSEEENKEGEWIRVALWQETEHAQEEEVKITDYQEAEAAYFMKKTDTTAVEKTKEQHKVHKEQKWKQHGDGQHGHGPSKYISPTVLKCNINRKKQSKDNLETERGKRKGKKNMQIYWK